MATITAQKELDDGARRLWLWETLTETDVDGSAVELPPNTRMITVQAIGTFGGGTVTWQGSLDGTNWYTLEADDAGNDLAFTAAGGGRVANGIPRYLRPLESAGAGVDIDARAFAIT